MTLGEKIKFYRTKSNLSQEELAHKSKLSRNAIYNYENNKRAPTISTLELIAYGLELSVSDLLEDSNNEYYSNKLGILNAIDKDIKNTILVEKEKSILYEDTINDLYKKYFFDLFNWKTAKMNPHEYFTFILSLSQLNEINYLTEEDIEELSILFNRLLSLKAYERDSLNELEKKNSGHSKRYEKNNFLTTHTK